jgi:general secretion pathway protein A
MALYTSFYGLTREPFSLSPDPAFIYPSPSHREAIAQLIYAVQARRGVVVLTGEVGTGKTTLLRNMLRTANPGVRTAYLLNPPRTRGELYLNLAAEFQLELGALETATLTLHRFLVECFERRTTVVALFDEAQQIPCEVLEEIRLLTNLETADTKLLQVILAGQPEFDAVIDSNEMRALKQRISLRHRLVPLMPEECVKYISTRLKRAGAVESPFELDACRAIHRYSGGIPRLINLLCDSSMLSGYVTNCRLISPEMVKAAAIDSRLNESVLTTDPRRTPFTKPWLLEIAGRWRLRHI